MTTSVGVSTGPGTTAPAVRRAWWQSRLEKVDFSSVYFDAGQRVLVLKNSDATSLDDLHGQKVCATTGSDSVA